MSTRFHEDNAHAQCVMCNRFKHGNYEAYEVALRRKIGNIRFEQLNSLAHKARKYSDQDLRDMITHYTAEIKRLQKVKGVKL